MSKEAAWEAVRASESPDQLLTVGRGPGGLTFSYKPYSIWPGVLEAVLFVIAKGKERG